jgi:hypothetical protein
MPPTHRPRRFDAAILSRMHSEVTKFEAAIDRVDDPFPDQDGRSRKIEVLRNIRASSVVHLHSRGRTDDAQLEAGKWFESIYEAAEIRGAETRLRDRKTYELSDDGTFWSACKYLWASHYVALA